MLKFGYFFLNIFLIFWKEFLCTFVSLVFENSFFPLIIFAAPQSRWLITISFFILCNLIEASKDLGLNRIKTFFKVILPLSVPGIVAGSLLVFIPVVGEFIIPEMLGGSDRLYYGKILWEEFFVNRNWPGASALAFSGIIILVLPIVIFQILYSRWSQKNEI